MAVASDISPNTDNLVLATGRLEWKGPGDAEFIHMGEVLAAEFTLAVTEKPHISKLAGKRVQDFSISEMMSATFAATLQEITSRNLMLELMANKDDGPPVRLDIGANSEITGALRFVGTNDVGPRDQYDFDSCKVTPNAALNLLSDDWGNVILTFKVNWNPTGGLAGAGAFGICLHNITDEVP
jgi:hypothetical protein